MASLFNIRKVFNTAALAFAGFCADMGAAEAQFYKYCAPASNPSSIAAYMPDAIKDLRLMEKLPLTGAPVTRVLADPSNRLTICTTGGGRTGTAGSYDSRLKALTLVNGQGSNPTIHEGYHAVQDAVGKSSDRALLLTEKDAAISLMLAEATAVAYELAIQKEAKNKGYAFNIVGAFTSTQKPVIDVFDNAYAESWQKSGLTHATTREAVALSAAGQAVVSFLMNGGLPRWSAEYMEDALYAISSVGFPADGREKQADYKTRRQDAYNAQGNVLGGVNFVPPAYVGSQADQFINESYGKSLDAGKKYRESRRQQRKPS